MRNLKQYWQSLFASNNKSVKTHAHTSPGPAELEHEIAAVSSENQTLAANLEEVRQEIAATRNTDKNKLAELERINHTLETARQEEFRKLGELENRLDVISSEHNQAHNQIKGLKVSLDEASTQLEKTDNQVKQMELEQRLHEKMLLETQTQLRTQDQRLSWTMMVAGFAVVLATVSGAILILEAHKNATLLTSMNDGMQHLLTSMDRHLNARHQVVAETPVTTAMVTPATTPTAKAADPDNSATTTDSGLLPEAVDDTAGNSATHTDSGPLPEAVDDTAGNSATHTDSGVLPEAVDDTAGNSATHTDSGALPEAMDDTAGNSATHAGLPDSTPAALDNRQETSQMLSTIEKNSLFKEATVNQEMKSLPGGIHYRIETPGRGRSPEMTDRVVVNYLAISPDGKVIDDTYSSGQPVTLHISQLSPALQDALLNMGEGAEWEVTVPEQRLYQGTQRSEPGLYLIELLEVIEGDAPDPSMPPE